MIAKRHHVLIGIAIILIFRLLWAGLFAAVSPLWEHFDEYNHYQAARYRAGIIQENPDQAIPPDMFYFSQMSQPPLYHRFAGMLIGLVDDGSPIEIIGSPEYTCNLSQSNNFFIHDLSQERPSNRVYRGIWLARALNILVGVASVGMVWLAARELWPLFPMRAWLGASLFAVYSPAAALSAWFNNDTPLMLVGAAMLWLLARWYRSDRLWNYGIAVLFLLSIGIGIKVNALALLPIVLYVVTHKTRQHFGMQFTTRQVIIVISVVGLILLTPLVISYGLCGNFLCRTYHPITIEHLRIITRDFVGSMMGQGLLHLLRTSGTPALNPAYAAQPWMIALSWAIFLPGILNAILRAWEHRIEVRPLILLLLVIFGALMLSMVRIWWLRTPFMPARYFAVAFPAFILIIALGYDLLIERVHQRLFAILPVAVFILLGIAALFVSYRPLWEYPDRVETLPADIRELDLVYEGGLQIDGYTVSEDNHSLTFWMHTERRIVEPIAIEIALLNAQLNYMAGCEMLAGNPNWPTTSWQSGEYVAQHVSFGTRLNGFMSIQIRVFPLSNTTHIINPPAYSREFGVLQGNALFRLDA